MNYRDVFGEVLADHHESPRNWGLAVDAEIRENGFNPLCGDKVTLGLKMRDGKLVSCTFEGEGCSICMASASIMTEMVQGQPLDRVSGLIEGFRAKMQGEDRPDVLPSEDSSEDIVALYGIKRFPVRIKCALLPWTTLKKGLETPHA
jgi:nitrogen fixation NifU-like protein